jgi:hypothetical protein
MSLSIQKSKKTEPTKGLGIIRFGKARPYKTKYVLVDITYDDKAAKDLHQIGMELLAKDKEAVINYVVNEALKNTLKKK